MAKVRVQVKYKYWSSGSASKGTTSWVGSVDGKSESSIRVALKRKHPGKEVEILNIQWK